MAVHEPPMAAGPALDVAPDPVPPPRPHGPSGASGGGFWLFRRRGREHIPPLGHQPALDGLRAVAVSAVLVYHARFGWTTGGFLGVSTFFTLSGFLITSLLLREWARSSSVDLRRFWGRRFRRLLPASWFTLALVLAMGAVGIWDTDQLRSLRGDVPFALAEIINWHFIAQDRTYGTDVHRTVAARALLEPGRRAAVLPGAAVAPDRTAGPGARGTGARSGGGGVRRVRVGPVVAVLVALGALSAVANGGPGPAPWTAPTSAP